MTGELLYDSSQFGDDEDDEDPFETDPEDPSFKLEERILDEADDFGTVVPGKDKRVHRG